MTFLQPTQTAPRIVHGFGPKTAQIAIIGEAPGAVEDRVGKPFMGPAGKVLDQCLHSAGLIRSQIYITNVVKERPTDNKIAPYWNQRSGFTEKGRDCVTALQSELRTLPNLKVAIPMGNVPLDALTSQRAITKFRGYPMECEALPDKTILPCIHPAAALRGKYIWRYYIMHDLMRASRYARESFALPNRDLITDLNFKETCEWIKAHRKQRLVSFDIEVLHYQVSCISFSSKENYAISVPMNGKWNAEEEALIWKLIAELLEDPRIAKVGQNLMFDISFLALQNHILTRGPILDTMIEHSVMYPDFEKSLGFLASIYTDQRYWKNMVDFKRIKKDD